MKTDRIDIVFSSDSKIGPRCGMTLLESALGVESALDLGIGPRSGTNPRSEFFICKFLKFFFSILLFTTSFILLLLSK